MNDQFIIMQIAAHYGLTHQLIKTSEELGELQAAISKFLLATSPEQATSHKDHVIEEAADCYIMVMQLRELLSTSKFDKMVTFKLERQQKRMERQHG